MYSKKMGIAARRATSLLSAIAASSFLGLPALAQVSPNEGSIQCVPATSQSRSSSTDSTSTNRSASNPTDTTSNSTDATVNSAIDAGTPGIRNFPNQTDPRAVPPDAQGTANNLTGTTSDSAAGSSTMTGTPGQDNLSASPTTDPSVAPTGSSTDRFAPNVGRTDNQRSNVTSGTGMSSGAGGVSSADNSSYSSSTSSRMGAYTSNRISGQQPLYGNILGRGGSTNGGGARIRMEIANNPDWVPGGRGDTLTSSFDQAQSGDNELSADAMTGNRTSDTQANIQTEGVTSGGQAANQSSIDSSNAGSAGMTTQPSGSMMNGGAIANCPPGMVPIQSRSNQQDMQQYNQPSAPNQPGADNAAPGRAFPNTRQTPQTNP